MNHMAMLSQVIFNDNRECQIKRACSEGPKHREPNKINWKSTETMVLDSSDLYAEQWSKRQQVDLKYLSEWKDQIKEYQLNHLVKS